MAYARHWQIISMQVQLGDIEGARRTAGGVLPLWELGKLSAEFTRRDEMAKVQALYEEATTPEEKASILLRSAEVLASKP